MLLLRRERRVRQRREHAGRRLNAWCYSGLISAPGRCIVWRASGKERWSVGIQSMAESEAWEKLPGRRLLGGDNEKRNRHRMEVFVGAVGGA